MASGRHPAQDTPLHAHEFRESIKESMRAGELDCVTQIPRKFVLAHKHGGNDM